MRVHAGKHSKRSTYRGAHKGEHSVEKARREHAQAEEPMEFTECCAFVETFEPTLCDPSKMSVPGTATVPR